MSALLDNLRRKAANWNSPHVRRITAMIDLIGSGLDKLGVELRPHQSRMVEFDYRGHRYRAGYDHPVKTPRQKGALSIWRMEGVRKVLVRRFYTLEQASIFCLHPTLDVET